jgi:double-stranded uracil-DNA glycosylase
MLEVMMVNSQVDEQRAPSASDSFAPIGAAQPKVLILGSLPGVRSLQAQQYYAHPRNAFWPIMAELCGFDARAPYTDRLSYLALRGVALWDVVKSGVRVGSLDSALQRETIVVNDLAKLLAQSELRAIACNGGAAAKLFKAQRYSYAATVFGLPSTSPAFAAKTFAQKLEAWRALESYLTSEPSK